jgi:hypothetical protein
VSTNPEIDALQRQVDALKRLHSQPIGDKKDFIAIQERAQPTYALFDDVQQPTPFPGETPHGFHQRTLERVKPFSPKFNKVDFSGCGPSVLAAIEPQLYTDVEIHAPERLVPGKLYYRTTPNAAGVPITRPYGHPSTSFCDQFTPPTKFAREGLNSFRIAPGARP